MLDLRELASSIGKLVDLEFRDGHAVRAKLVAVDLDQPEEIIYDVVEVRARGPAKLAIVGPGTVAATHPSELRSARLVP